MKSRTILVDIDGCLADPVALLREEYRLPVPKSYDFSDWGEVREEALKRLQDPDFLLEAPCVPGSREFLQTLAEEGWTLAYATSRPEEAKTATLLWLARHGYPGGILLLAQAKEEIARALRASWALEDSPAQVARLLAVGVRVLVPDWPYAVGAKGGLLFPRWRWERALEYLRAVAV